MKIRSLVIAGATILGLTGCATASPKQPAPVELNTYILLDRTGSMGTIWDEAVSSVNSYVQSVIEPDDGPQVINDITLAAFDSDKGSFQFDVLRKNVKGESWKDLTKTEVSPRGMTPLFDAIGRMISVADTDAPEKAVIVVMTDGRENASREFNKETAKAALERAEKKGWEVVFLGAEFGNFADADAMGLQRSKQMAVHKDKLDATMRNLAKKNRSYAQELADDVEFNETDRKIADEDDVKQRKGGK